MSKYTQSQNISTLEDLLVKIVKNLFQQGMLLSKQLDSKKYKTSTEDGQVMYQCTDCEYMNPVKDIIRNHVESHHMSTSFACPLGGHPCPTRNALKSSDIESIKNDILGLFAQNRLR